MSLDTSDYYDWSNEDGPSFHSATDTNLENLMSSTAKPCLELEIKLECILPARPSNCTPEMYSQDILTRLKLLPESVPWSIRINGRDISRRLQEQLILAICGTDLPRG